jgi:phosphoenolpyruvate carboxykinase (GTP)
MRFEDAWTIKLRRAESASHELRQAELQSGTRGNSDTRSEEFMNAITAWVDHVALQATPRRVQWLTGGPGDVNALENALVERGEATALEASEFPHRFAHRRPAITAPNNILEFVSASTEANVGPTNNFMARSLATRRLWPLFKNVMREQVMYVVPYALGPTDSPLVQVGVQITDSPWLALALLRLHRTGPEVSDLIPKGGTVARGLHTDGHGLSERGLLCHFPENATTWAIGLDDAAFLSRRNHALRLASWQGSQEGWLASRMSIVAVALPSGDRCYVGVVVPPGCEQTTFSLVAGEFSSRSEVVSTGVAWLRRGGDGRLWAVNPESSAFVQLAGLNRQTCSGAALDKLAKDALFSNVALTAEGRPWWVGGDGREPLGDSIYAAPAAALRPPPAAYAITRIASGGDASVPVPLSAIVFVTKRGSTVPLALESRSWEHGCYLGATLSYESSSILDEPSLVLDPMGMRGACTCNISEYLGAWFDAGRTLSHPPKIFVANWHRRSRDGGTTLWPQLSGRDRVLDWIVRRSCLTAAARSTLAGAVPAEEEISWADLDIPPAARRELLSVDAKEWDVELGRHAHAIAELSDECPPEILREHQYLERRVEEALGATDIGGLNREALH